MLKLSGLCQCEVESPRHCRNKGVTRPEYKSLHARVKSSNPQILKSSNPQILKSSGSQLVWVSSNCNDAARDRGFDVQGAGTGDQFVAFGARVQPDLGDVLSRDLFDDPLADFGRNVKRGHVDWTGHVEN